MVHGVEGISSEKGCSSVNLLGVAVVIGWVTIEFQLELSLEVQELRGFTREVFRVCHFVPDLSFGSGGGSGIDEFGAVVSLLIGLEL